MKRIKIKKANDYCCPNCKEDLRKVGVIAILSGWKADKFVYDENGEVVGEGEEYDADYSTDRVECGNCSTTLHGIDEYWDFIPKLIN